MAVSVGCGSASSSLSQFLESSSLRRNVNNKKFWVSCVSSAVNDPYKTLSIRPDASESEVKKAFRKLALTYHPDVCRGTNCGTQFHQINEAYAVVMSDLRGETRLHDVEMYEPDADEALSNVNDSEWELWEEWMGWEGAGIRDYSSHINPYI